MDVHIARYDGPRAGLRHLFRLAEDSDAALDGYIDGGDVIVATVGAAVAGHLQLIPTDDPAVVEVKNMAVLPAHQGAGIGRTLVATAVRMAACDGRTRLLVGTAAADVGNLRFYQRQGFRMRSIERDAFTAATGYHDAVIDGIPLRDRVWLDRPVRAAA
jgi:GNAT superfamily N-acetyltransferase